jgi:pimeloyl-ACP methyl ester carboxylesterase
MGGLPWASAVMTLLFPIAGCLFAQQPLPWRDPSPHAIQFISVDDNLKLEVLDWGSPGTPLVLLAGLGNTAHVFDEFAPKLTSEHHQYWKAMWTFPLLSQLAGWKCLLPEVRARRMPSNSA